MAGPGIRVERAVLLVLDGVGVGELPDAHRFGDRGCHTLRHVAEAVGGLHLPHLARLGLGNIEPLPGVPAARRPRACFGKMAERSAGKDSTTGHWELAGVVLERPFPTYPSGFPPEIIEPFQRAIGRRVLGNRPASGTAILEELGPLHLQTGWPIVYTSADSVFQVAAHEEVIPVDELYRICMVARRLLQGQHAVGRVIARPFLGRPGSFWRTDGRRDFSLPPPRPTLLDVLRQHGRQVWAVGKVADIFAGRGIGSAIHTRNNDEGLQAVVDLLQSTRGQNGLIFANLVDFDTRWGHRNDPQGFAAGLEALDRRLAELLAALGPGDALVITADHGNDPTTPGTDHTREFVPLLVTGPGLTEGVPLGVRSSFADVAATLAELLGVDARLDAGRSFAPALTGTRPG